MYVNAMPKTLQNPLCFSALHLHTFTYPFCQFWHTFGVQNPTLSGTLVENPTLCGNEVGQNGTLAVLAYAYCRQWECPPPPGQNPTLAGTLLEIPTLCGTEICQNGTLAVLAYAYCHQWECPPGLCPACRPEFGLGRETESLDSLLKENPG